MKRVEPCPRVVGTVRLAGDKSLSHRYAILAAMADGITSIRNYSSSDDCLATLNSLGRLGAAIQGPDGGEVEIRSRGLRRFRRPAAPLDLGNSGTGMRLLAGALAAAPIEATLVGDESLSKRPMGRILKPLVLMGAEIETAQDGFPPLHIRGARLHGIRYVLPIPSAQVKSCVLLAGLSADGTTEVVEPISCRDHTERALPFFGADFLRRGEVMSVRGGKPLHGCEMEIPGDFSGAVFFIVAALMLPGSEVMLRGMGMNPTRTGLLQLLRQAGDCWTAENLRERNGEPVCDLVVRHDPRILRNFPAELAGAHVPNLIDEIPALCVLATGLEKGLVVRGAAELRKKECDRIAATVSNLRAIGVEAEELPDGLRVPGGQIIQGGQTETREDHRIAMAFSVAGLASRAGIAIDRPECTAVSFPGFFECLETLRC